MVSLQNFAYNMCNGVTKKNVQLHQVFWSGLVQMKMRVFDLVGEIIFYFILAVYVQKLGICCNDRKMISAGR